MKIPSYILPGCALLMVLALVTLTRADPDLWGHVRFGGDIIDSATIKVPETYSFTSDKPWINHEWLAEIVMAAAYRTAGAAGLVLLKLAVIATSLLCIWSIARSDGADVRSAAILTTLALGGILPRAQQIRPQLFSVLCFSLLVLLLRRAEKRPALLWLTAPLFAFWANSHGGWLVGVGTLGLWTATRTWMNLRDRQASSTTLAALWAASAAAVLATLINPYGIGLWRFLASTVGLSRRFIAEWGPVTGEIGSFGPWCLFAVLAAIAVSRADRRARLHAIVIPVFWGIAGFKVSRLDSFFALSTIAFLAPELSRFIQDRRRTGVARQPSLLAQGATVVLAIATLVGTLPLLKTNLLCIDVHAASTFPESEAMAFVRDRQLRGRMVTFFDWGQYAIWHKPADLRVSMDGRRETVYSDRSVDLHLDMYLALEDGLTYLESLNADYAWVPKELPLAGVLGKSAAWTPIYRGGRSLIYARSSLVPRGAVVEEGTATKCRCFPGP